MARRIAVGSAALVLCVLWAADRPGEQSYQRAVELIESKGDVGAAIKLFQEAAKTSDRDLASRSLLYLGICYEKLGQAGAENAYRTILREFADQPAAAQARNRLAVLKTESAREQSEQMARKIERSGRGFSAINTDGQRIVYRDNASGDVIYGDVAGSTKRVIFQSKPGELAMWVPSLDFSMVALVFNATNDRPRSLAVINIDGTGYRELVRNDESGRNQGVGFDRVRRISWSWDNRYLLVLVPAKDDFTRLTGSGSLLVVSVSDGKRRKLIDAEPGMLWGGIFSPDGRFVAYEVVSPLNAAPARDFVVPSGGGKPHLIHEEPRGRRSYSGILDWTADGRYLAISTFASGAPALHLFPVENGQSAGPPVPVRKGHFVWGHATMAGALICELDEPVQYAAHVAQLKPDGSLTRWQRLDLREPPLDLLGAHWSPDGNQIVYSARNEDLGQSAGHIVRIHDLTTGLDREIRRSSNITACVWGSGPSKLYCREFSSGGLQAEKSNVYSLSLESGAVSPLHTFPGTALILQASQDGRALYVANVDWASDTGALVRWELATKQETVLLRGSPHSSVPRLTLDGHWIVWAEGFRLQSRLASGGEWNPLVTINKAVTTSPYATEIAPTPDGKWVIYHDVDTAGKHGLFRVPISGGPPERLGDYACIKSQYGNLEISPDGRKILAEYVSPEPETEIWMFKNLVPISRRR